MFPMQESKLFHWQSEETHRNSQLLFGIGAVVKFIAKSKYLNL